MMTGDKSFLPHLIHVMGCKVFLYVITDCSLSFFIIVWMQRVKFKKKGVWKIKTKTKHKPIPDIN